MATNIYSNIVPNKNKKWRKITSSTNGTDNTGYSCVGK